VEDEPSWYIVAKQTAIAPDEERFFAKAHESNDEGTDTSHVPMLSKPKGVAAVSWKRRRRLRMTERAGVVNVGLPRDVEWQGRWFVYRNLETPCRRQSHGAPAQPDGDGQLTSWPWREQRAIMVIQLDPIDTGKRILPRRLGPGQVWRNLTVDGLADDQYASDR